MVQSLYFPPQYEPLGSYSPEQLAVVYQNSFLQTQSSYFPLSGPVPDISLFLRTCSGGPGREYSRHHTPSFVNPFYHRLFQSFQTGLRGPVPCLSHARSGHRRVVYAQSDTRLGPDHCIRQRGTVLRPSDTGVPDGFSFRGNTLCGDR